MDDRHASPKWSHRLRPPTEASETGETPANRQARTARIYPFSETGPETIGSLRRTVAEKMRIRRCASPGNRGLPWTLVASQYPMALCHDTIGNPKVANPLRHAVRRIRLAARTPGREMIDRARGSGPSLFGSDAETLQLSV